MPVSSPSRRAAPFLLRAQTTPAQTAPAQNAPEIAQHDEQAAFKAKVNLVMVPVVVLQRSRKRRRQPLSERRISLLFDKGKPQEIARFTVEKTAVPVTESTRKPPAALEGGDPVVITPERFVTFVFDDIHCLPRATW